MFLLACIKFGFVLWQVELAKMLVEMGQNHLFCHWADPGVDDEEKKAFFAQVPFWSHDYSIDLASVLYSMSLRW